MENILEKCALAFSPCVDDEMCIDSDNSYVFTADEIQKQVSRYMPSGDVLNAKVWLDYWVGLTQNHRVPAAVPAIVSPVPDALMPATDISPPVSVIPELSSAIENKRRKLKCPHCNREVYGLP